MRLLNRVVNAVVALATGLGLTFQVMLRRKVTVKYPVERLDVSNRFHGLLALPIDPETGIDRCIICFQCERICPDRCIHIVSDGGETPYRVKIRAPSFSNLYALTEMMKGWKIADVIAILGSIDIVLSDVDR